MLLPIATVVVLVLFVVALLPAKKRDSETLTGTTFLPTRATSTNIREQQLQEEADAIAAEYRRRADEAWLEEVNEKASALLKSPKTPRRS